MYYTGRGYAVVGADRLLWGGVPFLREDHAKFVVAADRSWAVAFVGKASYASSTLEKDITFVSLARAIDNISREPSANDGNKDPSIKDCGTIVGSEDKKTIRRRFKFASPEILSLDTLASAIEACWEDDFRVRSASLDLHIIDFVGDLARVRRFKVTPTTWGLEPVAQHRVAGSCISQPAGSSTHLGEAIPGCLYSAGHDEMLKRAVAGMSAAISNPGPTVQLWNDENEARKECLKLDHDSTHDRCLAKIMNGKLNAGANLFRPVFSGSREMEACRSRTADLGSCPGYGKAKNSFDEVVRDALPSHISMLGEASAALEGYRETAKKVAASVTSRQLSRALGPTWLSRVSSSASEPVEPRLGGEARPTPEQRVERGIRFLLRLEMDSLATASEPAIDALIYWIPDDINQLPPEFPDGFVDVVVLHPPATTGTGMHSSPPGPENPFALAR